MKASIYLKLDGQVLEHDTLLTTLYIVKAFKNDSGECISLSYHVDSVLASNKCEFFKECYSELYHGFWVDDSNFITLSL